MSSSIGHLVTAAIAVAAVIHLLPLVGVLGAERVAKLYDIPPPEGDLEILMRHRAVLFGLLGVGLMVAAFTPTLQPAAIGAGAVSAASFIAIARQVGGYNDALRRVVVADWIALASLTVAAGALALG